MKIVIDLDEKYYNDIKNSPTASNYSTLYALFGIRNGTPLPKGHGRLIDADLLKNQFPMWVDNSPHIVVNNMISKAPTIIEANTESEVNT